MARRSPGSTEPDHFDPIIPILNGQGGIPMRKQTSTYPAAIQRRFQDPGKSKIRADRGRQAKQLRRVRAVVR
ncbi:hypothetical protein Ntsu_03310 [Nocardia sp. IFM 10818]